MSAYRRHFSILEMVSVLVVVIIMLAITAPVIGKILSGNAVGNGAREVGGELHIARAACQAKRRYVAVLMPGAESGITDHNKFTCFRLAYVNKGTSTYTFDSFLEATSWKFLPTGAAIMEADGDKGINDDGTVGGYSKLPKDNGESEVDDVDLTGLGGGNKVDDVRAIIYSPSGKPVGTGLYITVGEAFYSGSSWTIKDPEKAGQSATNQSCKNQMTIVLNAFTGALQYKMPHNY
jgi:hypothetical protein